ncbi:MAG: TraB/GumN family protein [Gammaproteobacteria bacterium]|nr:TraB/GumN family protein [Gammaproteobacteria bacterium]NIR98027.1 TraB/GumN family protein [Gammaproteobacteria bacterium]NIV19909.1 TraB/GumN family protein [Gammaproteobacteria bacterium]NIX11398.1 TraB/GumN family protein [Gammaproteobacteria bacterium]
MERSLVRGLLLIAAVGLLAPSGALGGPVEESDPFAQVAPHAHSRGVFWEISREGRAPSYLLGTMHVADPAVTTLPAVVSARFREADVVCTEVRMDYATVAAEMRASFFGDGRTLRTVAGDALFARTVEAMAEYGVPKEVLNHMKPWAVAYTLSLPPSQDGMVLDMQLYADALDQGKTVCGLETAEEHGAVFDALSMDKQVHALRETLAHLPQVREAFEELLQVYLARDLAGMVRASAATPWTSRPDIAAELVEVLIVERNRRMVARMEPHLRSGGAFFAVGALHLPGEVGILRLLEQRGYTVTPLY